MGAFTFSNASKTVGSEVVNAILCNSQTLNYSITIKQTHTRIIIFQTGSFYIYIYSINIFSKSIQYIYNTQIEPYQKYIIHTQRYKINSIEMKQTHKERERHTHKEELHALPLISPSRLSPSPSSWFLYPNNRTHFCPSKTTKFATIRKKH